MDNSNKNMRGINLQSSLLILASLAVCATSQPITIQSATRIMNFTNTYSMEYFTHNGGGKTQVRFLLRLKDYDISSWTSTQGNFGIWLGIGFGKTVMDGSDIVHCQYAFSNNTAVD
jgi:hypothetical protein